MLEILEQPDAARYAAKLGKVSQPPVQYRAVEAMEKGKPAGWAVYSLEDGLLRIYQAEAGGDRLLLDGIIRAVMLKAVLKGILQAEFLMEDQHDLQLLSFVREGENRVENLLAILDSCESCKKSC